MKVTSQTPVYLLLIVDVEEEGLFSGRYPRQPVASNVAALPGLAPLTREQGIPLTLVCAHSVFTDPAACRVLLGMRDQLRAEIGAHLHYWSTPPHTEPGAVARSASSANPVNPVMAQYVAAKDVPEDILRAKLSALFTAARECCGAPVTSFRMGRWDLARSLWPLLEEQGVLVDSSVRPWQYPQGWRDHFLAPTQPYSLTVNGRTLLEVPDTAVPLLPGAGQWLYKSPAPLLHRLHQGLVMTPNPVYHSLFYMKAAAQLMLARGQRVISLTWHSSEVMPGATPHLPTKAHVDAMLGKVSAFVRWLSHRVPVQGVTLGQLGQMVREGKLSAPALPAPSLNLPGDWHP